MHINLKHMNANGCWNVIVDMHDDYHQNLKHHKYTYNQFVPNDKRMHEFMEIEKPTHEQIKHYRDIFLNEIYNKKDLQKFDNSIINDVIPKMQMAIECKIKPLVHKWGLRLPEELNIVCAYGRGGSYFPGKTPVILFRCSEHSGMGLYSTFMHELVHLLIEEPIIMKYNVPQDLKERIVDLICLETIGRPVQEWCKESFVNSYITPEVVRTDLDSTVKKMMADYTAIKTGAKHKGQVMKLTWRQKDFKSDIDFIYFHQQDDTPMWWKSELYRAHPSLDFDYAQSLTQEKRFKYLHDKLKKIRQEKQSDIENSIRMFENAWEPVAQNLNNAYSSAFDMDCSDILNDMVGLVGLNPICPRDLSDNSFSVYYYFDPNYAVATALHEITHFVWFYVWQQHFKDDEEEYNFPHLKWLLSELVVETIIRNSDIAKLTPPPEYIAYNYFYSMDIDGKPIFDTLHDMYIKRKSFPDFMETAYDWIRKNEPELRAKIAAAEK